MSVIAATAKTAATIIYLVVHVCQGPDNTDCQVWVPDKFSSYSSCENTGLAHYNDDPEIAWYCVAEGDQDFGIKNR